MKIMVFALAIVIPLSIFARTSVRELSYAVYSTNTTTNVYLQTIDHEKGLVMYGLTNDSMQYVMVFDTNINTRYWGFVNRTNGNYIRTTNEGALLRFGAKLRSNAPIEKDIVMPKNGVYYPGFEQAARRMLALGTNVMQFYTVRPDTGDLFEMEVKLIARETVNIAGKKVDAVKVHGGLAGFLSIFWGGSDYWFRASDLEYIRFKGEMGPPGSPTAVVELVSEKVIR
ncbi:MAG: hypothetical protein AABZ39_20465 [Spirochaetota bacterium]